MRPVVCSIVALAIAIAPFTAMAASPDDVAQKPVAVRVAKHTAKVSKASKIHKAEKAAKDKVERTAKADRAEGVPLAHVKHNGKRFALKSVLHHAQSVDVTGVGHNEPKIDRGVHVVPASMVRKQAHAKLTRVSHVVKADVKPVELPRLPNPHATKVSKTGVEKGARKATEKKNEDSGVAQDGRIERDEERAEPVAPTRGKRPSKSAVDPRAVAKFEVNVEPASEPKAEPKHEGKLLKRASAKVAACVKDPVEIIRGPEIASFRLTNCDGAIAPLAIEHLSILARPGSAARPVAPLAELAKKKGAELAPGVRRVDERLVLRLQMVADRFGKPGTPIKLSVVSGYRPTSIGSMHATGRAIDFRVEGARNEDVVGFCKTLTDTGCGSYPNSSFVHLDVRDPGSGHVSWIDASGPGEAPRYVSSWPLPPSEAADEPIEETIEKPADKPVESVSAKEPVAKPEAEAASEASEEQPAAEQSP